MGDPGRQAEKKRLLSPWASAFFSAEMVGEAEQQMQWQGYQTFQHGKMFVVLVHPRAGTDARVTHEATIPKLRRIIADMRQQFPDLRISLTGEPVLDYDEMMESQRDATHATVLTLALIATLFAVGFREVLRPVLALGCMVIVLAVSMGYATLSIGHLNMITVTFAVMILGLGIDLGIQFIARYEEELSKGDSRTQAVTTAIEHTGSSIVTAGVTNAAAFFAMGLSGFRGVTELGVIAGGGMLIATAAHGARAPGLVASGAARTRVHAHSRARGCHARRAVALAASLRNADGVRRADGGGIARGLAGAIRFQRIEPAIADGRVGENRTAASPCGRRIHNFCGGRVRRSGAGARAAAPSHWTTHRRRRPQHCGIDSRTAGTEAEDHPRDSG